MGMSFASVIIIFTVDTLRYFFSLYWKPVCISISILINLISPTSWLYGWPQQCVPHMCMVSALIEFTVQVTGMQYNLMPNNTMQSKPKPMFWTILNSCLNLYAKACGNSGEVCRLGKRGVKSRLNEERIRRYIGEMRILY